VPNDQPFVITAKITPDQINHLFVGQTIMIKFLHKGAAQDLQGRLQKFRQIPSKAGQTAHPFMWLGLR